MFWVVLQRSLRTQFNINGRVQRARQDRDFVSMKVYNFSRAMLKVRNTKVDTVVEILFVISHAHSSASPFPARERAQVHKVDRASASAEKHGLENHFGVEDLQERTDLLSSKRNGLAIPAHDAAVAACCLVHAAVQ
jgi:hypothetical protein